MQLHSQEKGLRRILHRFHHPILGAGGDKQVGGHMVDALVVHGFHLEIPRCEMCRRDRLNTERKPIEGLYAVGNCSGSMYAGSYPELFIGNANGRTITHARHAVMHIAGEVK